MEADSFTDPCFSCCWLKMIRDQHAHGTYSASFSRINCANCVHLQVSREINTSLIVRGLFCAAPCSWSSLDDDLAVDMVEINQKLIWMFGLDTEGFKRPFGKVFEIVSNDNFAWCLDGRASTCRSF